MKLLSATFLSLCLWVGPTLAHAADAQITSMKGSVWVTAPGKAEKLASTSQGLDEGTRVRTGDNSSAELKFPNGSMLKLRANSAMRISSNKRTKKQKNSVILFFGRVWSKVAGSEDRSYEVTTANAVCGVRGTEFETAVGDDGSVRVRVTEGTVAVGDDSGENPVTGGQEIEGNEDGLEPAEQAAQQEAWAKWEAQKRERLRSGGRAIVDKMKGRIMSRKQKIETLRAEQKEIEAKRQKAEQRLKGGDRSAVENIRKYNEQLAALADAIADIGDETDSQFGLVDHYADLAEDPRFKMVDRKYLVMEAKSLRRVKKALDALVAEGTDISIEAMDKMLEDMSGGKGTLRDDGGSSADDLFGKDDDMFK